MIDDLWPWPEEEGRSERRRGRVWVPDNTPFSRAVLRQGELFPANDFTQRWRNRQHSWRHRSEGGFDKRLYEVALIERDAEAKSFIITHHYSGSYVAAVRRYGLYDRPGNLVGVAVLSMPMRAQVLTAAFPDLLPGCESLELGRLVLLDEVPANAESHFLGQVWRLAARDGIQGVVSFSDPLLRTNAAGEILCPGHVGTSYQAGNADYLGRSTARTLTLLPNGQVYSDRTKQKVRKQERGAEYGERQLRALGARARKEQEDPRLWLAEALNDIGARFVAHPGNHEYAFRIGPHRRQVRLGKPTYSYPKKEDAYEPN